MIRQHNLFVWKVINSILKKKSYDFIASVGLVIVSVVCAQKFVLPGRSEVIGQIVKVSIHLTDAKVMRKRITLSRNMKETPSGYR